MLPDCDELFFRYFEPWYSASERERRGFSATRPDMMQTDYFVGKNSANSSPLPTSKQSDSSERIATMLTAARSDWSRYLHLPGDPDLRWIETFDEYYDRDHIEKIISKSDPREFSNDYVVICCEFGAVLAHVMISLQPRLEWCYEWPYWESAIFDPQN